MAIRRVPVEVVNHSLDFHFLTLGSIPHLGCCDQDRDMLRRKLLAWDLVGGGAPGGGRQAWGMNRRWSASSWSCLPWRSCWWFLSFGSMSTRENFWGIQNKSHLFVSGTEITSAKRTWDLRTQAWWLTCWWWPIDSIPHQSRLYYFYRL